MTLKLNGYSTAQFGKCHEVPVWQSSPMGPFDAWPSGGGGFETFYGFIGGENNQWDPALYDGTTPVEPPATPEEGYHLTEDLADHACSWVRQQKALMPDKPFFVYFAPGRDPRAAPRAEGVDRQVPRASSTTGWDVQRERTFARQKELGVIPRRRRAHRPARRDPGLGRHARRAQAGARARDGGVRRASSSTPTTTSGGSSTPSTTSASSTTRSSTTSSATTARPPRARSTARSTRWRTSTAWPPWRRPSSCCSKMDEFGSPSSYNHYSVGWAWAMDTPFQWTKQVASHWGGTRNGTIVHWPDRHRREGRPALAVHPRHRRRARRSSRPPGCPSRRWSTACSSRRWRARACCTRSATPERPERHDLQYFEMFGNRGIYHQGWSAVTKHRTPWVMVGGELPAFDDDVWELYDGTTRLQPGPRPRGRAPGACSPSCSGSGSSRPRSTTCCRWTTAPRSGSIPTIAGRPTLIRGNSQLFFPGMGRLSENSVVSIKNKSFSVTAEIDVPDDGADGVIIAQGGRFGGWAVYAKDGKAKFIYNVLGIHEFATEADDADPAGNAPGADGVRLRRRRPGQGRRRHPLLRRRPRSGTAGSRPPSR